MTPQDAVNLVTSSDMFGYRQSEDNTEFEVFADGWNILIVRRHAGFARKWPQHMSFQSAELVDAVVGCELSQLECRRIENEVSAREKRFHK